MKRKPWLLAAMLLPLLSCRPGADFKVSVRVIDEATGKPIPDAWVLAAVAVKVEPEREPPYNRAVAGTRGKTDRKGIATFEGIEGIYWGEEPQDKLWLMLESRKPKVKRRITLIKEGDLFVFAKDYGALHHPLHFKGTPQEHAGMGPFGIKGEDEPILLDPSELKDGAILTVKMARPDKEYLYGSFHPDTFLPAIWAATSKKTGATKAEKRAVYDFFVRNLAPLDRDRPDGAYRGHIKPEALLDPKVIDRFVNHAPARDQGTAVQEWVAQKALELLPAGYEEVKEYAQEILAGVREEEEGDRPLNHTYDPSDPDKAMPGGETALKWGAIGYPDNPRNDWDWEDALRYYRAGEKTKAYRALGHVVHLLADATRGHAEDYERRLTDLAKANGGTLPPQYATGARMPVKPLPPAEAFAAVAIAASSIDAAAMNVTAVAESDIGQGRTTLPQGISAAAGLMARFLTSGSPGLSAKAPSQTSASEASDAAPPDAAAPPPSPSPSARHMNGEDRHQELLRNRKAFYGDRFKEYKAGRLSDEEVYIDLQQLVSTLANLREKDTPEFADANAEFDRLKRKHPEFRDRVREMFEAQQSRVRKTRPDIAMRGKTPPAGPTKRSAESFRPKLGPRDKDYIEQKRKQIAEYGKMLEEYHNGQRSDADGYVILNRLIWAHGAIGAPDPAAVEKLQAEFRQVVARHPEFSTTTPRLSDDIKREEGRKREAVEREEKLKTWRPLDSRPIFTYFDRKWALAVYSYRLEFYEANFDLKIPLEDGYPVTSGRLPQQLLQQLGEGKARLKEAMTFEHVIALESTVPLPNNKFILACADRFVHYKPGPTEEGALIGGSRHWSNPSADVRGEKCLVLSIDGKTRFEFPIHSNPPHAYIMPLGVSPDGSSALLGEGEAVVYEEKAGGWGMDRCRNYLLWTPADGIRRIPVGDVDAEQEVQFQQNIQAQPCPR